MPDHRFDVPGLTHADLLEQIARSKLRDEEAVVNDLVEAFSPGSAMRSRALDEGRELVRRARAHRSDRSRLDAFLEEYGLSNEEGVALLCLAEALLRIPDDRTADALISDKVLSGDWATHLGGSDALLVNASTWALMLTGRVITPTAEFRSGPATWLRRLVSRTGEPVIRSALYGAMRILGHEFVLGESIDEAIRRGRKEYGSEALFSFDMLGEGARTEADAAAYGESYAHAIDRVSAAGSGKPQARSGVSVKLSALHPRYEVMHFERVRDVMYRRLKALALRAAYGGIGLSIDAEESSRLLPSMELFERLARDPDLAGWDGAGFVVQAYGKRARDLICWLKALARDSGRRFPVRLVKGAYWDAEIKHAQVAGLVDFPVFTRKASTDLSWLVCAAALLENDGWLAPQFATHNAHSVASVMGMAAKGAAFEFQRLHGMGELLYRVAGEHYPELPPVRTYAPVGGHEQLVSYLVRRLLENGANSSFVNRFLNARYPVDEVVTDPFVEVRSLDAVRHPDIALPASLFAPRRNALSLDLDDKRVLDEVAMAFQGYDAQIRVAAPLIGGRSGAGSPLEVHNPARLDDPAGVVIEARAEDVDAAVNMALAAQSAWDARGGSERAGILERVADAFEADLMGLMHLAVIEAGKTIADALDEVREAVDFLRYYASLARIQFEGSQLLPGPTGERNELSLHGRGVFACISPWNFPLAIFTGQVAGALAAGNAVVAKPADQTPLMAFRAVTLMHGAGVPVDVLHLLPGSGPELGEPLVMHPGVAGVAFTGSEATARSIARRLAERPGPLIPLIAETGGLNAMFVDASALPEQVTDDVLTSAFGSAGQRCSALRVLYVQDAIADDLLAMIEGAMDALVIGDPRDPATDVGPVIDDNARNKLHVHAEALAGRTKLKHRLQIPHAIDACGSYVAPMLLGIDHISDVGGEQFGPILHVRRFRESDLKACLAEVAEAGYGLTFGLHSRIERRARQLFRAVPSGNMYVNRNMIGAVVGSQPFGGQRMSGTGPKAGGPHYLLGFSTERTFTVNTAASGGNAELLRKIR